VTRAFISPVVIYNHSKSQQGKLASLKLFIDKAKHDYTSTYIGLDDSSLEGNKYESGLYICRGTSQTPLENSPKGKKKIGVIETTTYNCIYSTREPR